jgi:hypothetical protein
MTETATAQQLKDDIDSGRTGDKVAFPDPAAAPLGTDEEAGGAPTHPREFQTARRQEADTTRGGIRSNGSIVVMISIIFAFAITIMVAGLVLR